MVDALLVHSNSSNCQEDVDKFLFSLGNMTGGTADPPPTTTDDGVSSHLELPATVRSVLSRVNRDDTIASQETNILAYIAGYISSAKVSQVHAVTVLESLWALCQETLLITVFY